LQKKQKLSRKDAEPQRYRKEKLCGTFAALRALLIFFLVAVRPCWDNCFAFNGFALIF